MKLGVDTGGTFTDFVLQTADGLLTYKTSSTPDDPGRAILAGLAHFFGDALPADLEIVHGSTVGTNAFLERKGEGQTVLLTTHGFEDVLLIGRQNRAELYNFMVERPAPVIGRENIVGVRERILFDGSVETPLARTAGRRLLSRLRRMGARSVAVCLLHSYANPEHEKRLGRELAKLKLPITLSSEILPEFREYERTTTTLINAYLAPLMSRYLHRLEARLAGLPLFVQQSNGGILPAAEAGARAVHTVLSGPAGGVHGAHRLATRMGVGKIISFDMGGTSTDVSLCDGAPSLTREYSLDGFPVRIQVFDIHTVGAGGGSLAWIDPGGHLRVGPQSAGADPGPLCYGLGEGEPAERLAVTDANLFLGRLLADRFLGGAMQLDRERVEQGMAALGARLGLAPLAAARGIIRLVNANMAKAVRAVSLERGHDPKEFVLFCFGGAGGLHCCELARELDIRKIVVPARAGILSAQGMVQSDPKMDFLESVFLSGDEITAQRLAEKFHNLEEKGRGAFRQMGLGSGAGTLETGRFLNLRYQGQSYELTVPFEKDFAERFHQLHEQQFGYRADDHPLELITVQVTLLLRRPQQELPESEGFEPGPAQALGSRLVHFATSSLDTPVYDRKTLTAGRFLEGPALVVDDYTTVLVEPGFRLEVDRLLNLVLSRGHADPRS